jgi:GTP-binding protein EngB required for normal cell division
MAYKTLKQYNVPPRSVSTEIEKAKAEKNASKPVSVNAAGKGSAVGQAHLFETNLTKELKEKLWKEMREAIRNG